MEQDKSRSKVWKKTIGKVRRGTGLLRYGMRRGRSKVQNKTIREAWQVVEFRIKGKKVLIEGSLGLLECMMERKKSRVLEGRHGIG